MRFQPYDPRAVQIRTRRNLPHWHQPGATYFVTFRLCDALPAEACARYAELRALNADQAFEWLDHYLDVGPGSCILAQPENALLLTMTLRHFDGVRYSLGAFAVMPNHVHALVQPVAPFTLTAILHTWKSFTGHRLKSSGGRDGQVWQEESFDRIVRNETELHRFHDYILGNPAAAHLPDGKFIVGEGTARWPE